MGQGALVPFAFPFAAAAAAGGSPQAMQSAGYEAARRAGIELASGQPSFVLGNIGAPAGGLLATLGQEVANIGVEKVDKALGHRAALARGNVFAVVDELIPVLQAGVSTNWSTTPQGLLAGWAMYNQARTAYDPAGHGFATPGALTNAGARYGAKLGLYLARKALSAASRGSGIGRYFNLRNLMKAGA